MKIALIAAIAHTLNVAYCESQGDFTHKPWAELSAEQQAGYVKGVEMHIANPDTTPEQAHEAWLLARTEEGWSFGEIKDVENKLHPCFLPYDQLPAAQKAKDYLFRATVHAVKDLPDEQAPVIVTDVAQATEDSAAMSTRMLKAINQIGVQYIGRRPEWTDRSYGTGLSFAPKQVRILPGDIARLLLKHEDIFQISVTLEAAPEAPAALSVGAPESKPESKVTEVTEKTETTLKDDTAIQLERARLEKAAANKALEEVQNVRDQVGQMTKDNLLEFAKTKYQQDLSKKDTVDSLRTKVNGFIDQFGLV